VSGKEGGYFLIRRRKSEFLGGGKHGGACGVGGWGKIFDGAGKKKVRLRSKRQGGGERLSEKGQKKGESSSFQGNFPLQKDTQSSFRRVGLKKGKGLSKASLSSREKNNNNVEGEGGREGLILASGGASSKGGRE